MDNTSPCSTLSPAVAALVTHYHPDHIGGNIFSQAIEGLSELMEQRPMKIYANKHEAQGVCRVTGLSDNDLVKVDSNDTLRIGDVEIEFLHTPGHTPGSQCFLVAGRLIAVMPTRLPARTRVPGPIPITRSASSRPREFAPDTPSLTSWRNFASVSLLTPAARPSSSAATAVW